MSSETALLVQEKLAGLQGSLRQLKEDKIQLQAEIDLLKKEKEILMKALNHFTALENQAESLQNKNILLQSQLHSLLKAIATMERDS
jgi:predicted transcriptional regulator